MLFQRLYNWIKYKTLPPSVLFKNRLFIERDNKHRRILTNFGLTFRNSKWSSYSTYNIKHSFRQNYSNFLILIVLTILLIIFLLNFKKYYLFFYFYNLISFYFWISLDSFDYYISYIVWSLIGFSSFFFNSLYSYFFFNNFSDKLTNFKSQNLNLNKTKNSLFLSKNDTNWFLYSLLTNNSSSKENKNYLRLLNYKLTEDLFSSSINLKFWNSYFDFYVNLFKTSYFFNLLNNRHNSYNSNVSLKKIEFNKYNSVDYSFNFYLHNSSLLSDFSSFFFLNFIQSSNSSFNTINKKYGNDFKILSDRWNLKSIEIENVNNNYLISNKIGFFFFNDLNHKKLVDLLVNNAEFFNLNMYLENQVKMAKVNRWLYRYSILHRKVFKNSHKITLSKKILNFNFYDSNFFNKNLWNSEYVSKYLTNNPTALNSFLNFNFNKLNSNSSTLGLTTQNSYNTGLLTTNLKFYENSYFWFLKRSYLFNSLSSNFLKSDKLTANNKKTIHFDTSLTFNRQINNVSFFLKSYFAFFKYFSNDFSDLTSSVKHSTNKSFNEFNSIFITLNDTDLYNKDFLTNLSFICNSLNNTNSRYVFFNPVWLSSFKLKKNNFSFTGEFSNINKFNEILFLSIIDTDSIFLKDLNYFFLFN